MKLKEKGLLARPLGGKLVGVFVADGYHAADHPFAAVTRNPLVFVVLVVEIGFVLNCIFEVLYVHFVLLGFIFSLFRFTTNRLFVVLFLIFRFLFLGFFLFFYVGDSGVFLARAFRRGFFYRRFFRFIIFFVIFVGFKSGRLHDFALLIFFSRRGRFFAAFGLVVAFNRFGALLGFRFGGRFARLRFGGRFARLRGGGRLFRARLPDGNNRLRSDSFGRGFVGGTDAGLLFLGSRRKRVCIIRLVRGSRVGGVLFLRFRVFDDHCDDNDKNNRERSGQHGSQNRIFFQIFKKHVNLRTRMYDFIFFIIYCNIIRPKSQ